MRKMTKGLVLVLLLAMLLSTVAMAAGSASSLIISAGEVTAEPGGTVTVPVSVTQNPGIVAVMLRITYDEDVLTLQTENGVVNKNLLTDASFTPNATTPGVVTAMFEKGTNEDGDITATGTLMELNFTVSNEAKAGDYAIAVTVQEARNAEVEEVAVTGQDGNVTVNATAPAQAQIENLTGTTATATVTAPASGWKDGANTFTVSNSVACVVLVKSGDTYTRLAATGSGNPYSFTTPEEFDLSEDQIVIAVKGDANGDGSVDVADVLACMYSYTSNGNDGKKFDELQELICDVSGNDGAIDIADVLALMYAYTGSGLSWGLITGGK